MPLGWDTPGYVWRTNLARAVGLANLPGTVPAPGPANPGRPGFVALAALLGGAEGAGPFRMAEALPGAMAASAGLAAGALIGAALHRPWWEQAAITLAVGTSTFMVFVINVEGYQDTVIALAIFLAAATPLVLCVDEPRALWGATILLGACAVVHWSFFLLVLGIVALMAVTFLPWSWRRWRGTGRLMELPSVRLAAGAVGGTGLAWAWFFGLLSTGLPAAALDSAQFAGKLRRDVPSYRLPLVLPVASAGALVLASEASEEGMGPGSRVREDPPLAASGLRRWAGLVLLLAWCEITLAGYVAERVFGLSVPTHRLLAYTMALPMLGMLAVLWVARKVGGEQMYSGRPGWRSILAGAIVLGLLFGSAWTAHQEWVALRPVMRPDELAQAAAAERYLEDARAPSGRPVVFVLDDRGPDAYSRIWLAAHTIRSVLAPARIAHTYFYVGTPQNYQAERPTVVTARQVHGVLPDTYGKLSRSFFLDLRGTYGHQPIALILAAANPAFDAWAVEHPGLVTGPGVAVVRGPPPAILRIPAPSPSSYPGTVRMFGLAAGALALLWLAGGGWTIAMLGSLVTPVQALALCPAVGAAMAVLGGVLLSAAGLPLGAPGGAAGLAIVAGTGWGLAGVLARRRPATGGRGPDGAGSETVPAR